MLFIYKAKSNRDCNFLYKKHILLYCEASLNEDNVKSVYDWHSLETFLFH